MFQVELTIIPKLLESSKIVNSSMEKFTGKNDSVPGEMGILLCVRAAQEYAIYYAKEGHKDMANWWHEQADYHADRLAEFRRQHHAQS